MTSKVEAEIVKAFDDHCRAVARLRALYECERLVVAGVGRFGGHYVVHRFWLNEAPRIVWYVPVKDFRAAAPMIEFIEGWTTAGLECKRTSDYGQLSHRDFHFGPLQLTCELAADSTNCRRVIKGYAAPEPIYEFECEEATQ